MLQVEALTGWQLYQEELNEPLLKFGDELIDKQFNGGLRKGITEISGEAGTGKTSFGMQLLFQCCLKTENGGLNAKAIYLSTEGTPPKGRYNQLLNYYKSKYANIDFGNQILMLDVQKLIFQEQSLFALLPKQVELNNVKLIVLDSIATFYRLKTNYIHRAKEMNKTCQHLRKLSYQYNMIVVLINQVTDVFPNDILFNASSFGSIKSSNRKVKPSLGLAWSNIINTRIMLARNTVCYDIKETDHANETYLKQTNSKIIRQIHIIFSPYLAKQWINFEINQNGIKGLTQIEASNKIYDTKKNKKKQEIKHKIFDGINEQELQNMFNSESQNNWNQMDIMNQSQNEMTQKIYTPVDVQINNNDNMTCSPTQIIRSMSNDNLQHEQQNDDQDIDIL
eukprot:411217_1